MKHWPNHGHFPGSSKSRLSTPRGRVPILIRAVDPQPRISRRFPPGSALPPPGRYHNVISAYFLRPPSRQRKRESLIQIRTPGRVMARLTAQKNTPPQSSPVVWDLAGSAPLGPHSWGANSASRMKCQNVHLVPAGQLWRLSLRQQSP